MAIHVKTTDPSGLLAAIKAAIEEAKNHPNKEGVIKGWLITGYGDFIHVDDDWTEKCWLRPKVQNGELIFTPLPAKEKTLTLEILGHRQGQFSGMLLTHFPKHLTYVALFP